MAGQERTPQEGVADGRAGTATGVNGVNASVSDGAGGQTRLMVFDESPRERASNLWMALEASNALLQEVRTGGVVEPDGWTIEELERLVDDLTRAYVAEMGDFADPRCRS